VGQADIKQTNKQITTMHIYLQKEMKCPEGVQGALQQTNRVDLIWVLREGLLAGVIIKLPAAGCAGVIQAKWKRWCSWQRGQQGQRPRGKCGVFKELEECQ
jgi:hypothetical protein